MTEEWVPREQIELVLRREFVSPFINSIRNEPMISLKLSNAFVLLGLSEQLILEFDRRQVEAGDTIQAPREKTLFLGYLGKIYQSALLLIGATDYLGAMILMRSVFELLVGIATTKNGSMRDRICSIGIFDNDEKGNLQKLWNDLSAWAHPYGKWAKSICPEFYGTGRSYHPAIFRQCLDYSDRVLDFLLTITLDHFMLDSETYSKKYREISERAELTEISSLQMFNKRMKKTP